MEGLAEFFLEAEEEGLLDKDLPVPLPGAAGVLSTFPKLMQTVSTTYQNIEVP
jgi:hypothetical protein